MLFGERKRLVETRFSTLFGAPPSVWSQAPGRVDLMGSHTDYNEGYVLTQAIDLNTWIAARPRNDGQVVVHSLNLPGQAALDLRNIRREPVATWANYIFGVAAILQQEGYRLSGFDGLVHSNVPAGGGLSSSAALEVAAAMIFDRIGNLDIPRVTMARYCQRAENEFVGLNCGILDQYSSLMGQEGCSMLLDCRHLSDVLHPMAKAIRVVVCDTRAPRELTGSEYADRRRQCEEGVAILASRNPKVTALRDVDLEMLTSCRAELDETVYRRCKFVVEENERVKGMAAALTAGDEAQIKRLSHASFSGARDLYDICVPEMEMMMAAMASSAGYVGGRQAGAGFGGCMVAFVLAGWQEQFSLEVRAKYTASTNIEPAVYEVSAARGAGILDLGAGNV